VAALPKRPTAPDDLERVTMSDQHTATLEPGSVIGILGGGQLGRMTAAAASHLGYRTHIYCPEKDSPAAQATSRATVASYEDEEALYAFAAAVDVVTFEFENVPYSAASFLAERVLVRPSPKVLAICQDRLKEKDFLTSINVPTARYGEASGPEAVARVLRDLGTPAVLKTARMGYDGKGQVRLDKDVEPAQAWRDMAGHANQAVGIVESFVDFRIEISVIVARDAKGGLATYVPVENQHKHHILDLTIAPARVPEAVADRAEAIARHIAESIELVGILCVEMFVTHDDAVLVNELAPRPHNSGHWTLDACVTSQFEQTVRAVAGLPLGSPQALCSATMKNLIGDEVNGWREHLNDPWAKLHLYGKSEARPGRKMGHVTRLNPPR
jgi:5-(carboxyamino)imidazole ribonucleotide synthase